jgi:hypothetical protein
LLGCAAALILSGCAALHPSCPPRLAPMVKAELFLGRNIGATEGVSDAVWQSFLNEEITPRFPDGFTVLSSDGQWRGPDGRIVMERGLVLSVVTARIAEDRVKLDEIRSAYRARFMQDAVLMAETPACAGS